MSPRFQSVAGSFTIAGLLLLTSVGPARAEKVNSSAKKTIDYNRDVRPILSDHCFACHGPDKNQRKADLRLDLRDDAITQGAIAPGTPAESALIERINADDPTEIMPPKKSNKPLSSAQKEVLTRWITEGAVYAAHWAYTPIKRPSVPAVKDSSRVKNAIDRFVQADLDARKLEPSPETDRRTLLRRLSLDLIGIPPTPEELQAFLDDKDANAYEKQVDRLLKSPQFGERMAVPWLDVVRYADTVGFHGDQNTNAWAYRDYVVDSINANKPFDQFTIEQLAGDLLPDPTPEQRAATCFVRLNMMTREGGAQAKEYLAKYAADRVRTVGMAWLGSTLACCECHDHKFDPFSARDFYSIAAFFADVKQWGVYADYGYTPNPDLRGYTNDHPFPPEIMLESAALKRRIARLNDQIADAVHEADSRLDANPKLRAAFKQWKTESLAFLRESPSGWDAPPPAVNRVPAPPRARKGAVAKKNVPAPKASAAFSVDDEGAIKFTGNDASNDEVVLQPGAGRIAAIRIELRPNPKLLRGASEMLLRVTAKRKHGADAPQGLAFRAADADRFAPRYRNTFALVGILEGWKVDASLGNGPLTAVYVLDRSIVLGEGDSLVVDLLDNRAAEVRVSVSPFVPADLTKPFAAETLREALERDDPAARAAYLRATGWDASAFTRVSTLEARIREYRGGQTPVMVVEAVKPPITRILPRGNWQDDSGPIVTPAVPHFLPQPKTSDAAARLNRLDLARWLVAPENPLTARVQANRLWKQFLGTGLSANVDDLGAQGEWPIHPDLLDWLASELRDGWDMKKLVRLIVTSHTYRQTTNLRPEVRAIDPGNRLLTAQSPRRLEAEFVRDNVLSIAGLLNLEIGGPPSKPYQPANYYANIQFPDRNYIADTDERQYRRGLYMHWQRTFLHPMLANFDAPSREDCIAARTSANSPQQALTLLNDPEFVEAARVFAASLLAERGTDAERLDRAYQRALARPVTLKETASLTQFLAKVRTAATTNKDDPRRMVRVGNAPAPTGVDPVELAAWTEVCRVILNLHETITRY